MNKKLVLAAALVFGVAGLILAQGIAKAQDANTTDNSVSTTTTENGSTTTTDNSSVNVDNTVADTAPAANAAQ